jgi:hypothetical protein
MPPLPPGVDRSGRIFSRRRESRAQEKNNTFRDAEQVSDVTALCDLQHKFNMLNAEVLFAGGEIAILRNSLRENKRESEGLDARCSPA